MGLGGIIAGAMSGAAKGFGEVADYQIQQQQKIDYAKMVSDMQAEKELLIDQTKRDRDVTDIGRKTLATANAEADAAPIRAKGVVAGEVAGIDAANTAGLPGKKAAFARTEFEANKPLEADKATEAGKNEGKKQTAKTNVPGFLQSLEREDMAKSAGERSVANISANAPKVTQLADGTFGVVTGGKLTSYLTDPETGEKLKGAKDLDSRTKAMVDALLLDAKATLDPDERKAIVDQAITLLNGGQAPSRDNSAQRPGPWNNYGKK